MRCLRVALPDRRAVGGVTFTEDLLDMLAEEGEIQQVGERYSGWMQPILPEISACAPPTRTPS